MSCEISYPLIYARPLVGGKRPAAKEKTKGFSSAEYPAHQHEAQWPCRVLAVSPRSTQGPACERFAGHLAPAMVAMWPLTCEH